MLKVFFYIVVCALRAYHYYRIVSNPACVALEIRDLSWALLMDALFLSCLWLLLFRLVEVRDALVLDEHGPFPLIAQAFWWTFLCFAVGGWMFSSAATHAACYGRAPGQAVRARAVSAKASAASVAPAASAASAALSCPSAPASAASKVDTH